MFDKPTIEMIWDQSKYRNNVIGPGVGVHCDNVWCTRTQMYVCECVCVGWVGGWVVACGCVGVGACGCVRACMRVHQCYHNNHDLLHITIYPVLQKWLHECKIPTFPVLYAVFLLMKMRVDISHDSICM